MIWHVAHMQGHPSGWTHDLGVVSAENRWVSAVPSGWYARLKQPYMNELTFDADEISVWCQENLRYHWEVTRFHVYMAHPDDARTFKEFWCR